MNLFCICCSRFISEDRWINEMLPYSKRGRTYVLYSWIMILFSMPPNESSLKIPSRFDAFFITVLVWFDIDIFPSNSTPRNRALSVGLTMSLNSCTARSAGGVSCSLCDIRKFDLVPFSLILHHRHHASSVFIPLWRLFRCRPLPTALCRRRTADLVVHRGIRDSV